MILILQSSCSVTVSGCHMTLTLIQKFYWISSRSHEIHFFVANGITSVILVQCFHLTMTLFLWVSFHQIYFVRFVGMTHFGDAYIVYFDLQIYLSVCIYIYISQLAYIWPDLTSFIWSVEFVYVLTTHVSNTWNIDIIFLLWKR